MIFPTELHAACLARWIFDHTTSVKVHTPLRPNDRRTGSVAVHAMPGAKWGALVNQWVEMSNDCIVRFFYVEAKECSLMNVGPPNPPNAQDLVYTHRTTSCTCIVQCTRTCAAIQDQITPINRGCCRMRPLAGRY